MARGQSGQIAGKSGNSIVCIDVDKQQQTGVKRRTRQEDKTRGGDRRRRQEEKKRKQIETLVVGDGGTSGQTTSQDYGTDDKIIMMMTVMHTLRVAEAPASATERREICINSSLASVASNGEHERIRSGQMSQ